MKLPINHNYMLIIQKYNREEHLQYFSLHILQWFKPENETAPYWTLMDLLHPGRVGSVDNLESWFRKLPWRTMSLDWRQSILSYEFDSKSSYLLTHTSRGMERLQINLPDCDYVLHCPKNNLLDKKIIAEYKGLLPTDSWGGYLPNTLFLRRFNMRANKFRMPEEFRDMAYADINGSSDGRS